MTPFLFAMAATSSWRTALLMIAGPYVLASTYLAPALAVIQNGVPVRHRATAGALFLLTLNLIGLGIGPLFVGMVSDGLQPRFGVLSLQVALEWLAPFCVLAAICQFAAAAFMHKASRTGPVASAAIVL